MAKQKSTQRRKGADQLFESFMALKRAARVAMVSQGRIAFTEASRKRYFSSPALVQFEGRRIQFFIDPTGVGGEEAICFNDLDEWIANAPEQAPVIQ